MNFSAGHAVVVGVGSSDLPNTADDAKALADILRDPEHCAYPSDQVQILINGDAARENVLRALANLAKRADSESTVIVYYSGHGCFFNVGAQQEYFLLTFGYDLNYLASTAVSDTQFAAALAKIECKKMLLVLDCCHPKGLDLTNVPSVGLKGAIPPQVEAILRARSGRVIIASSRADEVSFAGRPYSAFTQALLEGLTGIGAAEQDGYARVADLAVYTARRVPRLTRNRQHPLISFKEADNFPLAYHSAGDQKPKGSPFAVPANVEPEPSEWRAGFVNNYLGTSRLVQIGRDAVINGEWNIGGGAGLGSRTVRKVDRSPSQTKKADGQPGETRYVNLWLDAAKPLPLEVGETYTFGLNIGKKRFAALNSAKFSEPDKWKDADAISLTVIVTGNGVRVFPQPRRFVVFPSGDTEPVFFDIVPTRRDNFLVRISIYRSREMALLQEFECPIELLDGARAA
jgi:hypothetical protein